jgi:hypothetical protein
MGYLYEACDQIFFRCIFLSNYWWQESDIWSQASYRYAILWVAFLDPSDSYFLSRNLMGSKLLPTIWGTYMKLVTKYQISAINNCWEKCDEKWAYMFNVYKNQQSRQTGSRYPMGSKTLPTIWGTYMKLVTKYQISTIDGRNLIFGYKLHISTPYRGKSFWTHRIPTSCLPTLLSLRQRSCEGI